MLPAHKKDSRQENLRETYTKRSDVIENHVDSSLYRMQSLLIFLTDNVRARIETRGILHFSLESWY